MSHSKVLVHFLPLAIEFVNVGGFDAVVFQGAEMAINDDNDEAGMVWFVRIQLTAVVYGTCQKGYSLKTINPAFAAAVQS